MSMKVEIKKRAQDFSEWYGSVVEAADLAEHSPVRGAMTIKPNGYALWERIKSTLDDMIKGQGVENAYFPLFIPESYLKREAEHVEGFSPELAVVTHAGGKKLEEPLVVRPTSETIIYEAYSRWIQSYRDLPLLINQWANIVRWELRPRLFLRTTEFLWQEGHTVHESQREAKEFALRILNQVYAKFAKEYLAIPVLAGRKSEVEKFAGAFETYAIEALMQDGKSLQMGTSHNLSENFAKAFNIKFLDQEGKLKFANQTSWGVSTRLIGGLIMVHSDDNGLVLPPKVAPIEVVVVPISKTELEKAREIAASLDQKVRVKLDDRVELRPGEKYFEWEKKGVPLRIEIGPKDLASGKVVLVRRDTGEKMDCSLDDISVDVHVLLENIQEGLYKQALNRIEAAKTVANSWQEFEDAAKKGGFIHAFWCEDPDCELEIKEKTKVTTRCLPFDAPEEPGGHKCIHCGWGSKSKKRWVFSQAY